jgi:hypothetical protein
MHRSNALEATALGLVACFGMSVWAAGSLAGTKEKRRAWTRQDAPWCCAGSATSTGAACCEAHRTGNKDAPCCGAGAAAGEGAASPAAAASPAQAPREADAPGAAAAAPDASPATPATAASGTIVDRNLLSPRLQVLLSRVDALRGRRAGP